MSTAIRRLTYDDLLHTPDDNRRYEIIDGELAVAPAPTPIHQEVSGRLHAPFHAFFTSRRLGKVYAAPIDVRLSAHDIVEPDLIVIARDRLGSVGRRYVDGPPDLVVEILSPSTRDRDLDAKFRLYAASGIKGFWLVDHRQRSVQVFVLHDGAYELVPNDGDIARSVLFPGLGIDIVSLFADLT